MNFSQSSTVEAFFFLFESHEMLLVEFEIKPSFGYMTVILLHIIHKRRQNAHYQHWVTACHWLHHTWEKVIWAVLYCKGGCHAYCRCQKRLPEGNNDGLWINWLSTMKLLGSETIFSVHFSLHNLQLENLSPTSKSFCLCYYWNVKPKYCAAFIWLTQLYTTGTVLWLWNSVWKKRLKCPQLK